MEEILERTLKAVSSGAKRLKKKKKKKKNEQRNESKKFQFLVSLDWRRILPFESNHRKKKRKKSDDIDARFLFPVLISRELFPWIFPFYRPVLSSLPRDINANQREKAVTSMARLKSDRRFRSIGKKKPRFPIHSLHFSSLFSLLRLDSTQSLIQSLNKRGRGFEYHW